jgi:hypothetical protein
MATNPSVQSINGKKHQNRLPLKVGMMLGKNSKMNHDHRQIANSILSRLKDGEEFSPATVRRSLETTGDLAPIGSKGVDQEVQEESQGGRESRSMGMVATSLIRLSEKTWDESRRRITKANE